MRDRSPSIQELRELYDAAIDFKQAKCWDWMWDTDLFGVQDPESGEVGYCCVMGRAGEHFALAVYLGTEGLESYHKIQRNNGSLSDFDAVLLQKCLMASFEDRSILTKRDLETIKKLGLKFKGRNSWPMLRSYVPGYFPWHLNSEETKFLTVSLRQAVDVAFRFKDNPETLTMIEDKYVVRVPEKKKNRVIWKDELLEPEPLEKKQTETKPIDPDRLSKIRSMNLQRQGIWEIDSFYFPEAVEEKKDERPYFPRTLLAVDHHSGLPLGYHMAKPDGFVFELREALLEVVEDIQVLPAEMIVKNEESLKLLEPIASGLEINLRKAERLPMLEEAREDLLNFFRRQKKLMQFNDFPEKN